MNPDESFHHANGAVRYLYMKSLGGFDEWDIMIKNINKIYSIIVLSIYVALTMRYLVIAWGAHWLTNCLKRLHIITFNCHLIYFSLVEMHLKKVIKT